MAASPPGSRSLLRTSGIALLGVGIVAASIGLFTSATSGNGTGTAVPSASSQALPASAEATAALAPAPTEPAVVAAPDAATPAPEVAPSAPAAEPPVVAAPAAAPEPAAPPPAAPPAAAPPAAAAPAAADPDARAPLRVYNNSLIQGLAARAQSDFEGAGWTVAEAGNYSQGNIPTSTAYYRPGTGEEAAAHNLATKFGLRVAPRFDGLGTASPGVIVIVTNDYKPGR